MTKVISQEPLLSISDFGSNSKTPQYFPFNKTRLYLFGYARVALYEGLRILKIGHDDNILVPNYICNVVASPMHQLGIRIKFYDVDSQLKPKWNSLKSILDRDTKGLLIVNYFGFPNDLLRAREFCNNNKIYLIEDNAHGFLSSDSDTPLGSYGDISIFSFRKALSLPSAAALLLNNKELACNFNVSRYPYKNQKVGKFMIKTGLGLLKRYLKIDILKIVKKHDIFDYSKLEQEEFNLDEYFLRFPLLSRFLINHLDLGSVIRQRREAYVQWLKIFSSRNNLNRFKIKILFPELPSGVVPWVFPVLADNHREFIISMYKNGIECFPWPYLPRDSKEGYFSKRVVCLPISSIFSSSDILMK